MTVEVIKSSRVVELTKPTRVVNVDDEGVQGPAGAEASVNRIIMSNTAPTTRPDGTPLQNNDIWINTSTGA